MTVEKYKILSKSSVTDLLVVPCRFQKAVVGPTSSCSSPDLLALLRVVNEKANLTLAAYHSSEPRFPSSRAPSGPESLVALHRHRVT